MLLKYFYDQAVAHASYLVGCQKAKTAVVVDPGRDVEQYLAAAKREGVKIVAVAETHIHADYVSGARELADRIGAKLYVSDEGPADWKYKFADQYEHQLVNDGDVFMIGNIKFEVLRTPGHTPESISFMLTDQGGGADKPMGIFTGDFVFVGSIGRPDLLEEAAGLRTPQSPLLVTYSNQSNDSASFRIICRSGRHMGQAVLAAKGLGQFHPRPLATRSNSTRHYSSPTKTSLSGSSLPISLTLRSTSRS